MTAGPIPHDSKTESKNLDVLRAIAVLCVFGSHIAYAWVRENDTVWHFGQLGVLTFFVHTSLVLMMSLERLNRDDRGIELFKKFYILRAFRIYPLAIFWVLAMLVMNFNPDFRETAVDPSVLQIGTNLTLTTNLFYQKELVGGLWTLPIEVQMYVVLPFLFLWLRPRSWKAPLVLWFLSIGLAYLQQRVSGRMLMLSYAPCFMGGLMAWRFSKQMKPRFPGWLWPIAIAMIAWGTWFWARRDIDTELNTFKFWVWALAFAYCALLGFAIPLFKEMKDGVVTKLGSVVAKYSYSIYLSHIFVINITMYKWFGDNPLWVRLVLLCTFGVWVPFLTYHTVEAPLIKLGRYLVKKREAKVRRKVPNIHTGARPIRFTHR